MTSAPAGAIWRPKFSAIKRDWEGCTAALIGTGPSMKGFDFLRLDSPDWRIMAVKESMFDLPFAGAIFGLDLPWIGTRGNYLERRAAGGSDVILAMPDQNTCFARPLDGVTYVRRLRSSNRMSLLADSIECGANSGFGAINAAVHKGVKTIVLFGYDYTANGHYNQERYDERKKWDGGDRYFPRWATHFDEAAKHLNQLGVKVFNASPQSTVTAFERISHDDGMQILCRGVR